MDDLVTVFIGGVEVKIHPADFQRVLLWHPPEEAEPEPEPEPEQEAGPDWGRIVLKIALLAVAALAAAIYYL